MPRYPITYYNTVFRTKQPFAFCQWHQTKIKLVTTFKQGRP